VPAGVWVLELGVLELDVLAEGESLLLDDELPQAASNSAAAIRSSATGRFTLPNGSGEPGSAIRVRP